MATLQPSLTSYLPNDNGSCSQISQGQYGLCAFVYTSINICIVTRFEKHVSEMVCRQHPIVKFLGNRYVEAYISGNAWARETDLVEMGISFAVLP